MSGPPRAYAIVLAAGAGRRLGGGTPKALVRIDGIAIVTLAVAAARASGAEGIVVTAPAGLQDAVAAAVGPGVRVLAGGPTRQDSVRLALRVVPDGVGIVAIHDAARPFASPALFDAVIAAVAERGDHDATAVAGAIPTVPVSDTVKRVRDGLVVGTEPRDELVLAQTPQAFSVGALREAHARAAEAGAVFTDDAGVLEWAGHAVRAIAGEAGNFKVTTPADLERAAGHRERARG
jgi:2-C-methyl-D-erythritol 4-phosphate cytidylyltransferase / 2-C-methyl-D-erythritol 2,4-cyclodiphosphate synthase